MYCSSLIPDYLMLFWRKRWKERFISMSSSSNSCCTWSRWRQIIHLRKVSNGVPISISGVWRNAMLTLISAFLQRRTMEEATNRLGINCAPSTSSTSLGVVEEQVVPTEPVLDLHCSCFCEEIIHNIILSHHWYNYAIKTQSLFFSC